jgi:inorganic pyrophosphatase
VWGSRLGSFSTAGNEQVNWTSGEMVNEDFWAGLVGLVKQHSITIDRPCGTAHPHFSSAIYPVDYGYLEGTRSSDGEGIDVFVGTKPGSGIVAVVITADSFKADAEVKLILDSSNEEIATIDSFLTDMRLPHLIIER